MNVHQLFANTVWKLESQNARLKNKHPVLFNVAIINLFSPSSQKISIFVNKQLDAKVFFISVYSNSLHVSNKQVFIIRRVNCINTTSGVYHCEKS